MSCVVWGAYSSSNRPTIFWQIIPVGRLNLLDNGVIVRVTEFGMLQPASGDAGWEAESSGQFQTEIIAQVPRSLTRQLPVFTHGQEQVSRLEFSRPGLAPPGGRGPPAVSQPEPAATVQWQRFGFGEDDVGACFGSTRAAGPGRRPAAP